MVFKGFWGLLYLYITDILETHAGFRENRSIVDHLFTLLQIVQKKVCKEFTNVLFFCRFHKSVRFHLLQENVENVHMVRNIEVLLREKSGVSAGNCHHRF